MALFALAIAVFITCLSGCDAKEQEKRMMAKRVQPYYDILDEINQECIDAGRDAPFDTSQPSDDLLKIQYELWGNKRGARQKSGARK